MAELAVGLAALAAKATLGNVAAVAQLIGNAGVLITMITTATQTARQNKVECEQLRRSMSTIREILSRLPPDAEVVRPLANLKNTLQEAHDLVVRCQKRSFINRLFRASRRANKFRELNARITSDISVLNLSLHVADRRQYTGQTLPPNRSNICSFICCSSGM